MTTRTNGVVGIVAVNRLHDKGNVGRGGGLDDACGCKFVVEWIESTVLGIGVGCCVGRGRCEHSKVGRDIGTGGGAGETDGAVEAKLERRAAVIATNVAMCIFANRPS